MTEIIQSDALLMARAATAAALMGDDEGLQAVLADSDPELVRACCAMLTAMLAGQVAVTASAQNREPLEFWTTGVRRQVERFGR